MFRRVGAPGALAEQRGRGKRRGRLPGAETKEKAASKSAFIFTRWPDGVRPPISPKGDRVSLYSGRRLLFPAVSLIGGDR
jgi:hypothetical protein